MEYVDSLGRRHVVMAGCVETSPGRFTPFYVVRRGRADQEVAVRRCDVDDPAWSDYSSMNDAFLAGRARAIAWIDADVTI